MFARAKGPTWQRQWEDKALNWQVNNLDSIIDSPPGPLPCHATDDSLKWPAECGRREYKVLTSNLTPPPPCQTPAFDQHACTHIMRHIRSRGIQGLESWTLACVRVNKELINVPQTAIGNSWEMLLIALSVLSAHIRSTDWQIFQLFFHFVQWNVARTSRWNFYAI